MKFSTSFAFLSAFALAPMISAANLEEKWAINPSAEPVLTYTSLDFELAFTVTDFIEQGQAKYTLYTDGCKEDGTAVVLIQVLRMIHW